MPGAARPACPCGASCMPLRRVLHARCGACCMPGAAHAACPAQRVLASCMPGAALNSVRNSVRNVFYSVRNVYFLTHCNAYGFDAVRTVARIFPNQARCEKPYSVHSSRNSFSFVITQCVAKSYFTQLDIRFLLISTQYFGCVGHYALSFALLAGYVLRFFAVHP
jgi:hypothetical protein